MTEQKNLEQIKQKIGTNQEITWCPGCKNFLILEAVKKALAKLISEGYKQEHFAMATGIGCHQKIYDYLNINGIYGLHGRVIPTAYGMKLGNPNLVVLGFAGDGDAYAEGMEHFIHAGRFNFDMTYIVADNQNFALTTGQATPTSQQGYKNKAEPLGEFNKPLNPIKLALASGMGFVARCDPRDIAHTAEIIEKAIKHKGFAFIEMMQHCLVFNVETSDEDRIMYKVDNKDGMRKALELADEWDYNSNAQNSGNFGAGKISKPENFSSKVKIPIGILYQENKKTLEEEWPQLKKLMDKKIGWKNFKK